MKIGMVGSGTVGRRRTEHERDFGPAVIVDVWTLAHAASRLEARFVAYAIDLDAALPHREDRAGTLDVRQGSQSDITRSARSNSAITNGIVSRML